MSNIEKACSYFFNKGGETLAGTQPLLEPPFNKGIFLKNNWMFGDFREDYIAIFTSYDQNNCIFEIQILASRKRRSSCGEHNDGEYNPWTILSSPKITQLSLKDFWNFKPYLVSN